MSDIVHSAISFEGRKIRMNQTKEGWVLHLAIHPNDAPSELMSAMVGSRFAVVMVEIGDDEQPVISQKKLAANRVVQSAVMLGKNEGFQSWLGVLDSEDPEVAAVDYIKGHCGVISRTELAIDDAARRKFEELRDLYLEERMQG